MSPKKINMAISIVCRHATIIKRNDSHYSGRRTEVCGKIRGVGCLNVKLRVSVCVCVCLHWMIYKNLNGKSQYWGKKNLEYMTKLHLLKMSLSTFCVTKACKKKNKHKHMQHSHAHMVMHTCTQAYTFPCPQVHVNYASLIFICIYITMLQNKGENLWN